MTNGQVRVEDYQSMAVTEAVTVTLTEDVTTIEVPTVCASEFGKLTPPTEGAAVPITFEADPLPSPYTAIIYAAKALSAENRYHTDMPKEKYKNTVMQNAIWVETPSEEKPFTKESIRTYINEQVVAVGGTQTDEQIDQLTEHLWADIDLTIKRALPLVKSDNECGREIWGERIGWRHDNECGREIWGQRPG